MPYNVLYVGMMYDITTLINLEDTVDNIYVIDMVDLHYGQFIESKENSWITLKEKIKTILMDGFYIHTYTNMKQINKLGKAKIISEEDIIYEYNKTQYNNFNERHRWSLKFVYENLQKEINLIYYGGYCTEDIWPSDIQNINCIISIGAYFYETLDDINDYSEITKKMIIERCNLPLSYYKLYFNCNKPYYEKICNKQLYNEDNDEFIYVHYINEIGKTVLILFSDNDFIKLMSLI